MWYWNIARQRHYRALSAMLLDLLVSADRAAWSPFPHWRKTRAFSGTKAKSGERRTACWREMDSNLWYRGAKARYDARN